MADEILSQPYPDTRHCPCCGLWLKLCATCGKEKSTDGFSLRGDSDSLRASCRSCLATRTPEQTERRNELRRRFPERAIRLQIIQRCYNPNNPSYIDYGARGITVCDEWRKSFEAFFRDMGPRPSPEHSVERKDNSRGYYPDNCVWATKLIQNRNTRQNVMLTARGRTQCRSAWAEESGVPQHVIRDRMERLEGWDVESAIFTPVGEERLRA